MSSNLNDKGFSVLKSDASMVNSLYPLKDDTLSYLHLFNFSSTKSVF